MMKICHLCLAQIFMAEGSAFQLHKQKLQVFTLVGQTLFCVCSGTSRAVFFF